MTQERDGFSLAHRAALMTVGVKRALATVLTVAVIASLAVVGTTTTSYAQGKKGALSLGLESGIVVTNNGALLVGTIVTFPAGAKRGTKPSAIIKGATGSFVGTPVPAEDSLSGVAVSPNPLNDNGSPFPTANAIYAASDLSVLAPGAPDIVSAWTAGSTGTTPPIAFMLSFSTCVVETSAGCAYFFANPMSIPEGFAFIPVAAGGDGGPGTGGDFYVTQYTGAEFDNSGVSNPTGKIASGAGSVLEYSPIAGTGSGANQAESTFPLGEILDTVACTSDGTPTALLGPVGVALDSSNNIWVVNAGFPTLSTPSYVTEYAAGSSSIDPLTQAPTGTCVTPINLVGLKVLEEGEYDVISPIDGSLWVSDVKQNSVFEFDVADGGPGTVETTIAGKHSRLKAPMGIAMDAVGDLYVANNERNQILEFEDPALGGLLNVKPNVIVQGRKTQLHQPVGVALVSGVPPFPTPTATPAATPTPTATPTTTATTTPTATPTP